MRQCKIGYQSKQKNKSSPFKDETGITLIELLAAITILSVVILLAGSIHIFGQKQFIQQSDLAKQTNELTFVLSEMSKELRQLDSNEVEITEKSISLNGKNLYTATNNELKKGDYTLVEQVNATFSSKENKSGVQIELKKVNEPASAKTYETTVFFRGRAPNEAEN